MLSIKILPIYMRIGKHRLKPYILLFIWIFSFLLYFINPTYSFSKTNLEAARNYSDGIKFSRAKYWREAIDEFRKAIQADPTFKLAHANLGVALGQLGNHKEALLAFQGAINLGYDNAQLRYNMGFSFAKLNLIEEAIVELESSLKIDSRNVKAFYNLGILYQKINRSADALKQVNILYNRNNNLAKKLFDSIPPQYKVISVKNGGAMKGKVSLTGKTPHPRFFPLVASPNIEFCTRISDGKGNRILFDFTVSESKGLKDTIIKLVDIKKGKPFSNKIQKLVMNRCHIPKYVIGIRNGETLSLENKDPIRHEVATYEFTKRGANQRSNRPIDSYTSQARNVFVQETTDEFLLKCNLHPFLQTRGIMVDNPYYTITDKNGFFSIKDIPAGTYKVIAWHPFISKKMGTVEINPRKTSEINFEFRGEKDRRTLYTNNLIGYRFQPVYDSHKNFYGGPRLDDPIEILQEYKGYDN